MAQTVQVAGRAPDRIDSGPAPGRRRLRPGSRFRPGPYLLIAPTIAIIAALILYPIGQLFWMSFHKIGSREARGVSPAENVGLENFRTVLDDGFFWRVLLNTVASAAAMVIITMVLGTVVGLLLHRLGRKMSLLVSSGALLAWATPGISAAIVYKWLFTPGGGLIPWFLDLLPDWLAGSGWNDYNWFGSPFTTYFVLVLCVVWQSFPFIAVSVLAGLKSLPGELYEAARVDGAGAWRAFWQITFPLLRPVFLVLVVLSIIWDFKVFTQLYFLSGGTANRDSFNLAMYAYSAAVAFPAKYGLGGAIALILTLILLVFTGFYVRVMVKQGEVA
ncbi:carbohydrate ABC transporter permease [Actinomadura sp. 9N407]|uniref:carbohydrate ABC transporter permease n=1 Tax=Actinomadura sp. 9N407 TaxID=3375154 RepID=UPI0037A9F7E6